MPRPLLILCVLIAIGPLRAESLTARDGKVHAYETIEVDPATPKTAVLLRVPGKVTSLPLSAVDTAKLPTELAERIAAFTVEQRGKGLVLLQDEWVDRDGHLLKTAERFAYAKRLVAAGDNVFEVVNKGAERVTIGVRSLDGKLGLEIAVDPGKTRAIRLSDGSYRLLIVRRLPGGTELAVERAATPAMKNLRYTLTTGLDKGDLKTEDAGRIPIPTELR